MRGRASVTALGNDAARREIGAGEGDASARAMSTHRLADAASRPAAPPIVTDALTTPGRPLEPGTREEEDRPGNVRPPRRGVRSAAVGHRRTGDQRQGGSVMARRRDRRDGPDR